MNIDAIVRGASFEKTENTSVTLGQNSRKPMLEIQAIVANKVIAVISILTFSSTNEIKAVPSNANAIAVSIPIIKEYFYGDRSEIKIKKLSQLNYIRNI
tara:strand:- start:27 stop:323 length:297 start_codon:yes stop_codon:yes gene_type:complete